MTKERWLPVVGFEGLYEVSDQGRVRSLGRIDRLGRKWSACVLRLGTAGRGYLKNDLRKDGKTCPIYVHVAVLEAFQGPRPAEHEAAHRNGKRTDNRLSNLAWKTHSDNEADKALHGTKLAGDRHPSARISPGDVRRVRRSRASAVALGLALGVTTNHVRAIRRGRYWSAA